MGQHTRVVVAAALLTSILVLGSAWIDAQTERQIISANALISSNETRMKIALSREETKRLELFVDLLSSAPLDSEQVRSESQN